MSRRLDTVVVPGEAASQHLPLDLIDADAPLSGQQIDEETTSDGSPGKPRVTLKHVLVVTQDAARDAERPCEATPKLQLPRQDVEPRHARMDHEGPGQDAHRHPGPRRYGAGDRAAGDVRAQPIRQIPLTQC